MVTLHDIKILLALTSTKSLGDISKFKSKKSTFLNTLSTL